MSHPFFTLRSTYYLTYCPHCQSANWISQGSNDIEAIKCWNCEKVSFFVEPDPGWNKVCGYETAVDCDLVEDGQKSIERA